jgi:RNA polymerase sigma-70 factor (ECF subfamily)
LTSAQPTGRSDSVLIDLVRAEPVDVAALDELVARYWRPLFARCQLLAQDRDLAFDLAQEAWCRVLRARHGLRPDGNFPAYLRTIATNLWRDWSRPSNGGSGMSAARGYSLDAAPHADDGEATAFGDGLPDPRTLDAEAQLQLSLDLDRGLAALSPLMRDVVVARFLDGESAAEIGRRYGRTEQTITGWLRQATRELRRALDPSGQAAQGGAVRR